MKIRDLLEGIGQEHFSLNARDSLPNAEYWPELDNSSPYHAFRFSVAMAGEPANQMAKDGPSGQKLVTIGYTKADKEIIDATAKSMGYKSKQLSTDGSNETFDVGTTSPVAQWMKPTKKKKDKK